ncbi:MAG: hypothetical protein J6A58_12710 [Oscillospiraceae bacterium]|nr:hypothetical protein [Oscillospiraceae bacterium]MBR6598955.1 hypothetical protein [Oscillospiraceae bacterium]
MKKLIGIIMPLFLCIFLFSCQTEEDGISKFEFLNASALNAGTYAGIEVESNSSMFKVTDCTINVEDEKIYATVTLNGKGYGKLFAGTAQEAQKADESLYSLFTENADGKYEYTIEIEALDKEVPCAAWSTRKEKWYDRTLVFKSDSLRDGAIK